MVREARNTISHLNVLKCSPQEASIALPLKTVAHRERYTGSCRSNRNCFLFKRDCFLLKSVHRSNIQCAPDRVLCRCHSALRHAERMMYLKCSKIASQLSRTVSVCRWITRDPCSIRSFTRRASGEHSKSFIQLFRVIPEIAALRPCSGG